MQGFTPFVRGLVIGGAITSATLVGYAYGEDDGREHASKERAGECEVRVGPSRLTFGDQCDFDRVQVGTREDYILCADLEVTCPD